MNDKQIVKAALKVSGESQAALSAKLGYQNKSSIATMLSRPTELRMGVFYKILDALGFEIVIRPKNRDNKAEWLFSEDESPINVEGCIPETVKERITAKQAETEEEMEQIKRMMKK